MPLTFFAVAAALAFANPPPAAQSRISASRVSHITATADLPAMAGRLAELTGLTLGFNARLLVDWKLDKLQASEAQRAREARDLAVKMGTTFIKIGQALSIRTDLIPPAYALELKQLQDNVPAFDSEEARAILRRELRVHDLGEIFEELSAEPVASASIGQVYKGKLKDGGRAVAVKVQRPGVSEAIALDMQILRVLTPVTAAVARVVQGKRPKKTDIDFAVELVDEWSRGFVAETDYELEAKHTIEFQEAMRHRNLSAVVSPKPVQELSTKTVLVTEWVDGTRLDHADSPDVPELCTLAINAYLTMLLDTGRLHCDPHPGNLLRTADGKLCILDWGMTIGVPRDLQYALLEFIAHVDSGNIEAIPQDFVNLGLTDEDKVDDLTRSGMAEIVGLVLGQLNQGGGVKKMGSRMVDDMREKYGDDLSMDELRKVAEGDMAQKYLQIAHSSSTTLVGGVATVADDLSRRNEDLFRLPPYLLYMIRAFSTLEGIGLSIDENFAITAQTFPYLSKRLLTDDSPRARAALESMIYPQNGTRGLSKLVEMSEGFSDYQMSTSSDDGDAAVTELLKVLSQEDGFVQQLVMEEAAALTDAVLREGIARATGRGAPQVLLRTMRVPLRTLAVFNAAEGRGPLAAHARFLDQVADTVPSLAGSTEQDKEAIAALAVVWDKMAPQLRKQGRELMRGGGQLGKLNLPAIGSFSRRFHAVLLQRLAKRVKADAEDPRTKPLAKALGAALAEQAERASGGGR